MKKFTAEEKKAYAERKNGEKAAMDAQLKKFLSEALETKEGMDKLTAHYKISGLYNYSFFNSILILMQGGTIAQSFNKWKGLDRCVNKGEKSHISIYVPMFKKEKDANGIEETKLIGFKLGPVFDISQTSGKDLEYDHNSIGSMDTSYETVKTVLAELCGTEIVEKFTGDARGWSDGHKLTVSAMSNDIDKAKTAIHEAAHHLIHTGKDKEERISRAGMEVEAESITFLVLSYLGIDFDLTKEYVACWKAGIQDARTSLIIKTADKIIKAFRKVGDDTTEE